MNYIECILAVIGFVLSAYGYMTELNMDKDPTYKPACDINDRISCSKAFKSPYGKLFGVTNTIAGMVYYGVVLLLALFGFSSLLIFFTGLGVLATVCFAYLLIFKVKSYCLICISTYIINILLFLISTNMIGILILCTFAW